MIEERGQVMAIEGRQVRVAVNRQSACGSCKARAACGQGLAQSLKPGRCHEVLALCEFPVRIGDTVILGVEESLAVRGAVLVYLLPLLALLAGALMADWLGFGEPVAIVSALTTFAAAVFALYLYNRTLEGRVAMLPKVMRVESPDWQQGTIRWQP